MSKVIKDKAPTVARVLLGAAFVLFGLNGFLHFMPTPPPPEGGARAFLGGLAASGYFFTLLKGTEVLVGLLLISGRLVPLALTVLAPVTINIVAYHAFLTPASTLPLPLALVALQVYLAWAYRESFRGVLQLDARPTRTSATEARAHRASHLVSDAS